MVLSLPGVGEVVRSGVWTHSVLCSTSRVFQAYVPSTESSHPHFHARLMDMSAIVDPNLLKSPYGQDLARQEIQASIALTLHLQSLSNPDCVEYTKYCQTLIDAGAAQSVDDVMKRCPPHHFKDCYRKIVDMRALIGERYLMTRGCRPGTATVCLPPRFFAAFGARQGHAMSEEDKFLHSYEFVQCHTILAPQKSGGDKPSRDMFIMHSFVAA